MPDTRCPFCGETTRISLVSTEQGKGMTRQVWSCAVCGQTWMVWVEIKHQPFRNE